MERRDVLKGLSLAGTLAMGPMAPAIAAIRDPGEVRRFPPNLDAASAAVPLIQLENEYLSVALFVDASARIIDRKNHCEWRMGSVAAQEDMESLTLHRPKLRRRQGLSRDFIDAMRENSVEAQH